MRVERALLAALLCFPALAVSAATGDIAAGREKAAATCNACHGVAGLSELPGVPSLAGQHDSFVQWQLVFFRTGRRANEIMGPLTAELSDADIRNLGAYFASLPPASEPPAHEPDDDPSAEKHGKAVAESHHCAACHLDDFAGKGAAARIARQREDYLVKALADYRSSQRPSTGVAAMNEAAAQLSDQEIEALARYLSRLQ